MADVQRAKVRIPQDPSRPPANPNKDHGPEPGAQLNGPARDESASALAVSGHARGAYGATWFFAKPRQPFQSWRGSGLAEAPWRGIQHSPDGSPLEHGRDHEAQYCDRTNRLVAKVESQEMFRWGHVVSGTSYWLLCHRAPAFRIEAVPRPARDIPGLGRLVGHYQAQGPK